MLSVCYLCNVICVYELEFKFSCYNKVQNNSGLNKITVRMLAVQKWLTSSCCWWPNLLMSCGLQYCFSNSFHEGCIPVRGKGRGERGILSLSFYRNLKSFFKELLSWFFCFLTGCYIPFSLLVLYSNIFVLKEMGSQSLVLHCFFLCLHSFLSWAHGFRYSQIYISSSELLPELQTCISSYFFRIST